MPASLSAITTSSTLRHALPLSLSPSSSNGKAQQITKNPAWTPPCTERPVPFIGKIAAFSAIHSSLETIHSSLANAETVDEFCFLLASKRDNWHIQQSAHNQSLTKEIIIHHVSRNTSSLPEGMLLHALLVEHGFELDIFQFNVIIRMYGKFGALDEAHSIFDSMSEHNVASWNALMSAYMHQKCNPKLMELFSKMCEEGLQPDAITMKLLLRACVGDAALSQGHVIHFLVLFHGLDSDVNIMTCLTIMYGRCRALKEAHFLFESFPEHEESMWSFMILAYFKQGYDEDALKLYMKMQENGMAPTQSMLVTALKACTNLADLVRGEAIQNYISESSFAADNELVPVLINMYGRCGRPDRAHSVFESMGPHTVSSFNALIAVYVTHRYYESAIELLHRMLLEGLAPDATTLSKIMQACKLYETVVNVRAIHSYIAKAGLDTGLMIATGLVGLYGRCGEIEEACLILAGIKKRDVIACNVLLAACMHHENFHEIIQLFYALSKDAIQPNKETSFYVLSACAELSALEEGKLVHACMVDGSLDMDAAMASVFITMYGKCGALEDAQAIFNTVPDSNVVHWTAMIAVYIQHGKAEEALHLFHEMHWEGLKPNNITYTNALNACAGLGNLVEGQTIHACIQGSELEYDDGLENALLHMYCKCGAVEDARLVFDDMYPKKLVSWNVMIAAYCDEGLHEDALELFQQMRQGNFIADEITFVSVLRAITSLEALDVGGAIHSLVVTRGLESNTMIAISLINMYGKYGALEEAQCIFDNIKEHNVVSWTALITAYVKQGCGQEAIDLFHDMRALGIEPHVITLVSVLGAYANLEVTVPEHIIDLCHKCGFDHDVMLGNALITMYGKCGSVEDAQSVFGRMCEHDVATWNAMISVYGQHSHGSEALDLLQIAYEERISPNELTWIESLTVCADLGALGQGKLIHTGIIRCGFESNTGVGNALVNMYGKCGAVEEAVAVFDIVKRDVVSWNAILAAYSQHGYAREAVHLFGKMQWDHIAPDEVTFLTVLNACSHAGLVNEGCEFFKSMRDSYKTELMSSHYGCLVDLFGKSGLLDVAEDLICTLPVRTTVVIWMTLLGACRNHGDVERGERALVHVVRLDPNNGAPYVLLSNIYATQDRWEDVKRLRNEMLRRRLHKRPGCSMIEIDNEIHSFFPRDTSHPDKEAIYAKLEVLSRQLEVHGHVPDTRLALHNVDEESKKHLLCHHSERLALAFGLIKTPSRTPLLIVKNLRMCPDCHAAFKILSTITKRELTLRDGSRLHCFSGGSCSCGDFW